MQTIEQFLSSILCTVQLTQNRLYLAIKSAASHTFKSALKKQLAEFDRIEYEILTVASCRGWELRELQPGILWLKGHLFRYSLKRKKTDSGISELLIHYYTNDMIEVLKNTRSLRIHDAQSLTLQQKLLDCHTFIIRQLLSFL